MSYNNYMTRKERRKQPRGIKAIDPNCQCRRCRSAYGVTNLKRLRAAIADMREALSIQALHPEIQEYYEQQIKEFDL